MEPAMNGEACDRQRPTPDAYAVVSHTGAGTVLPRTLGVAFINQDFRVKPSEVDTAWLSGARDWKSGSSGQGGLEGGSWCPERAFPLLVWKADMWTRWHGSSTLGTMVAHSWVDLGALPPRLSPQPQAPAHLLHVLGAHGLRVSRAAPGGLCPEV